MRDCPHCQLVNPDNALRCDRGFDFQSRTIQKSYLSKKDLERAAADRTIESDAQLILDHPPVGVAILLWRNLSRYLARRRVHTTDL